MSEEQKVTEQVTEEVIQNTEKPAGESSKDETIKNEEKEEKPQEKVVEQALESSGFDYKSLEDEYIANNGELSKETLEKLNKQGFSNEFINDFIDGKKALYEQDVNELAEVIGGRETYDNVINWAAKNLDVNVIQAVNGIKDKSILKEFILPVLKSKMEEKEGIEPKITLQGTGGEIRVNVFESKEDMYKAIRDPRYNTDPVYQAKITAKIKASREAGIDLGI